MGLHSKEKLKPVSPACIHIYRPLLLEQNLNRNGCLRLTASTTRMKTENAFLRSDFIMNLSKVTDL